MPYSVAKFRHWGKFSAAPKLLIRAASPRKTGSGSNFLEVMKGVLIIAREEVAWTGASKTEPSSTAPRNPHFVCIAMGAASTQDIYI